MKQKKEKLNIHVNILEKNRVKSFLVKLEIVIFIAILNEKVDF